MDDDDVIAIIVFAVLVLAAFYMYKQQQVQSEQTALALAQAQENIVGQQIAYNETPEGQFQGGVNAVGNALGKVAAPLTALVKLI